MSYRYAIGNTMVGPWDYSNEDPLGEPLPEVISPVQDAAGPIASVDSVDLKTFGLPIAAGAAAGYFFSKRKSKKAKVTGAAVGAAAGAVLGWFIKRGTFAH